MSNSKYYAYGDQETSNSLVSMLDRLLCTEEALAVATASKVVRYQIAHNSPAQVKEIYRVLKERKSTNIFVNNQEASIRHNFDGLSIDIQTVRKTAFDKGKQLDSVLTVFDFITPDDPSFSYKIISEMVEDSSGSFEQLRFYKPDGSLLASKVYALSDMDLSIAECGWAQFALADITKECISSDPYFELSIPMIDKELEYASGGYADSLLLMNPSPLKLYDKVQPVKTINEIPFVTEQVAIDSAPSTTNDDWAMNASGLSTEYSVNQPPSSPGKFLATFQQNGMERSHIITGDRNAGVTVTSTYTYPAFIEDRVNGETYHNPYRSEQKNYEPTWINTTWDGKNEVLTPTQNEDRIYGDQEKSNAMISLLDSVLGTEETFASATASKLVRNKIAKSSPEQIEEIYKTLIDRQSVNSFLNNQEASIRHNFNGSIIDIQTVRNTAVDNGELVDSVLTIFDFGENCDSFSDYKIISEMFENTSGKSEQLRFYNPDGSLLASKTYPLGSGSLSIAECGWSQFALADMSKGYVSSGQNSAFPTATIGDKLAYATGGMGRPSMLMNPSALQLSSHILPHKTTYDIPFANNKPNVMDIAPQVTGGNLMKYASGLSPDFSMSGTTNGKGHGLGGGFKVNPSTLEASFELKETIGGEKCTFDLPATPVPDRICMNFEVGGKGTVNMRIEHGIPEVTSIDGSFEGSLGIKYEAYVPSAKAGAEIKMSRTRSLAGDIQDKVEGEVYAEVSGIKLSKSIVIHESKKNTSSTVTKEKAREAREKEAKKAIEEAAEEAAEEAIEEAAEEAAEEDAEEKTPGCGLNPAVDPNYQAEPPTSTDIPAGEYEPPKPEVDPCGTSPEENPDDSPSTIVEPTVPGAQGTGEDWGCGDKEMIDFVMKEYAERNPQNDPWDPNGGGWCGSTGKLAEAISAFGSMNFDVKIDTDIIIDVLDSPLFDPTNSHIVPSYK